MPSPEGEVDMPEGSKELDLLQESHALKNSSSGQGKVARINAKRKPDKSKIFRIRTNESTSMTCTNCCKEFSSIEELDHHESSCTRNSPPLEASEDNPDDIRRHQDEANNNQANLITKVSSQISSPRSRDLTPERSDSYDSDNNQPESSVGISQLAQMSQLLQNTSQIPITQQLAQSNVALEAIQNTRMALAQLASNALRNGQPSNPQAVREMAVLQSTLITLQHQQVVQLGLIQQLQAQLSINDQKEKEEREQLSPETAQNNPSIITKSLPNEPTTSIKETAKTSENAVKNSLLSSLIEKFQTPSVESTSDQGKIVQTEASAVREKSESPVSATANMASSVIQHQDPPPQDQPNTLEMLQKTTNQVLNNASQGLLTSRLIDDYNKPPDGKDSYYKHRCRYCGKVFGSDSALQIHVRSHTGERPFKCNICGNRFTTKGNLKVHFQRHSSRFPHIKMNPHPVPEHLDKLHPPILAQLGELKECQAAPTGPPNPFSTSPLGPTIPSFRLGAPLPPHLDLPKSFAANDILRREMSRLENAHSEHVGVITDSRNSFDSEKTYLQENIDKSSEERMSIEHIKEEDTDNQINKEDLGNEKEDDLSRSKNNFRDPLHEVFRNNIKEPLSEEMKESLRNTLKDHLKQSARETFREKLEESFKDARDQNLPLKDSFRELFKDQILHPFSQALKESLGVPKNLQAESDQEKRSLSSDRELETENSPLDIRIKGESELKEVSTTDRPAREIPDTDSNDSLSVSSEQPTDLRMKNDYRSMSFPNLPFSGPRLPLNFPFMHGLSPPFPVTSAPLTPGSLPNSTDMSRDPVVYSNLLPRPGSTDNSWEALIEVQKTSETMKLEQLVNNIEHKLSDPNQCIICHRVLSCKSALQMHYRTHTGERPFKCKICGRAFTTKGNLKTHMGVHRAKPPMRMLHQCPVCHKKFTNALVLQQHIRLHTGEPTDLTPEQIAAAEVRDFPPGMHMQPSLPQLLPNGFHLPQHQPLHGFPPLPLHMRYQISPEMLRRYEAEALEDRRDEEEKYMRLLNNSSRSSSTGSAEQKIAEDLSLRMREDVLNGAMSPHQSVSPTPSDYSDLGDQSHDGQTDSQNNLIDRLMGASSVQASSSVSQESSKPSTPIDLANRPPLHSLFPSFGFFPPPPLTSAPLTSGSPSMTNMNSLYMQNIPGRGNTTCHVCFKTFACQSALEIHYRSHTKERPFKCTICDRGFSTKGNMKQHMLTHKIRDNGTCEHSENSSSAGDKSPHSSFLEREEKTREESFSDEEIVSSKRLREDNGSLPIAKRPPAILSESSASTETTTIHDEPPVLSPEVPFPRPYSPPRFPSLSPASPKSSVALSLPSSFTSPLAIPSSLPIPPSFSSLISPASLAAQHHS